MAKPRRSRRTLTLVILVLVSLTIITIDQSGRTHHFTAGFKSVANDVFSPLRSGVNDILQPVGTFLAGAVHYDSLQQENHRLQSTLGKLRQQLAERSGKDTQLKELLALQHLPYLDNLPTVTAQTTAIDSSNFTATITIDQGRDNGVAYGMPVVGSGGLIGQVVEAYHTTSIVRLITDGQSKIGVTFGDQFTATVNGQGPGNAMNADFVAPETKLRRGELMVTSGFQGGAFPRGLPVATISSFRNVPGASQATVNAQPVADLDALAYVDVVQWEPAP